MEHRVPALLKTLTPQPCMPHPLPKETCIRSDQYSRHFFVQLEISLYPPPLYSYWGPQLIGYGSKLVGVTERTNGSELTAQEPDPYHGGLMRSGGGMYSILTIRHLT